MKKTMKMTLAFVAGAFCFTGCEQENMIDGLNNATEEVSNARLVTLTAYQEGEGVTRAAIDGTTSTQINWSESDKINYFGDGTNEFMSLQSGAGTPSGTFSGTVTTSTTDFVLYPYQESASCSADGVITANVPMTQYAVEDSFDPEAALMVGQVNGSTVEFKNVMSYVKVTIPLGMTNCKQVSLKAKDAWTTVAGKVYITPSTGEWTETTAKAGEAFVRLVPKSGDYLTAGASYYIAILPQTMATGFELIFNDNDAIKVKQSASGSVEFGRSKTKKLGTFSNEDASFTYKASAVQLATQLKVADRNIGAKGILGEDSYGDYFAWSAKRPAYITKSVSGTTLTDLYKESGYAAANTPYWQGPTYTKYTTPETLEPEDDIAAMLWGGKWRMPTNAELKTLMNDLTKGSWNSGYPLTGKESFSSNSVFLPASGYCNSVNVFRQGERGHYWASRSKESYTAYDLFFSSINNDWNVAGENRLYGQSVRAVLAE